MALLRQVRRSSWRGQVQTFPIRQVGVFYPMRWSLVDRVMERLNNSLVLRRRNRQTGMSLTSAAAPRSWRPQAIGFVSLVVGVLSLPLPGLGVDERRGSSGLETQGVAGIGWLAQNPPSSGSRNQPQELMRQADALNDKGDFREHTLQHRIPAIDLKTEGTEHHETASSLSKLGNNLRLQRRYEEAERLLTQALTDRRKTYGRSHPIAIKSLVDLARLHYEYDSNKFTRPSLKRAKALYNEALEILRQKHGSYHPALATVLDSLGIISYRQALPSEAERLFKQSLAIREKMLGERHPDVATSLNNLGVLHGDYCAWLRIYDYMRNVYSFEISLSPLETPCSQNKAESLLKRSLDIYAIALGVDHWYTHRAYSSLLSLYASNSRPEAARQLSEAYKIPQRSDGFPPLALPNPYNLEELDPLGLFWYFERDAEALKWSAVEMAWQHRYDSARMLFRLSLEISLVTQGEGGELPDQIMGLLALVDLRDNNFQSAEASLYRLNRLQLSSVLKEAPLIPRDLRPYFINSRTDVLAITFALIDQSPAAAPLALETRLNRQGLLAEIERRQALLKSSSPETRRLAEQVAGIDRRLASVALPKDQREPLRQQRQQLEAELYRLLPALRIDPVTTAQVAAALKAAAPRGLLIEFQKYRPYGKGAKGKGEWGSPRYVALLLRPDGSSRAIPLGDAAPIDAAVAEAVQASYERSSDNEVLLRRASDLVFGPLRSELSGIQELFLSPDGELHRLPFAALPAPANSQQRLPEAFRLRLLTTGRDLIALQKPAATGGPPVLMANPTYDTPSRPAPVRPAQQPANAPEQRPGRPERSGQLNPRCRPAWAALAGTDKEAASLAPLLGVGGPQLFTGSNATAAVAQGLKAPRLLHISTHGFFLPDQPRTPSSNLGQASSNPAQPATLAPADAANACADTPEDPLLRSGLVFAGANQPDTNPSDDGYLTAAETTALDLEGTELTTLSACQTGLGDIRSGEGLYGLQRALTVAGSRSTLLSLWKVNDRATTAFMEEFYKRLQQGQGRADALAATQAYFRTHPIEGYRDPYVWAAFQLTGDWRPLHR